MTIPTLALGISPSGADALKELANSVGLLKNNLAGLAGVAGGATVGLDALAKEFREMRQEMVTTMQGIRTDLAAGMKSAYAGAAATAKAGAKDVEEEVKKGAARIRVAAKGVDLGGLTASTSGNGIGSAAAVAKAQADLMARPEAQAAAMKKTEQDFIKHGDKMKSLWIAHLEELNARLQAERSMMDHAVAQYRAIKAEELAAQLAFEDKQKALWVQHQQELRERLSRERTMMDGAVAQFRAIKAEELAAQLVFEEKQKERWIEHTQALRAKLALEATAMNSAVAQFRAIQAQQLADQIKSEEAQKAQFYSHLAALKTRLALEARMMDDAVRQFRMQQEAIANNKIRGNVGQAMSTAGTYSSIADGSYGAIRNVPREAAAASAAVNKLKVDLSDAHSAARGLASGFGAMWLTWGNVAPLLAGAALSHGFVQTIKMGAAVQQELATIRVLSEETTESVAALNTQLIDMARNGPFGPLEIAKAMKTLSLAGLDAKEVGASIRDVLNFAVAGDTSIEKSADLLTTVGTAFKISAEDYGYIGDVIAKTAAVSKASVESISESFKSASVINSMYGATLKDVGLGIAILSNVGVKGSAAGVALRNFYVDIMGRTPKVEKAFKALGLEADFAFDKATGKARAFIPILNDLLTALNKKDLTGQTKAMGDIFTERGGKGAAEAIALLQSRMKDTKGQFANDLAWMAAQIEASAGFMSISFAQMSLTTTNQIKTTVSSLQASLVTAFDKVQPYVLATAQNLREAFNSEQFQNTIGGLVRVVGNLTLLLVEHSDKIMVVAGAWLALKVVGVVAALIEMATSKTVVATAALFGNAAAAQFAAGAQNTLAVAYQKRAVAEAAAAAASNGAAAATATVASRIGSVVAAGARFLGWAGLAIGAWQLYEMFTGKADEATKKKVDNNGALLTALRAEADRLRDVNQAKLLGISLDEMQMRKRAEALKGQNNADAQSAGQATLAEAERLERLAKTGPANQAQRRIDSAQILRERAAMEASAAASDARFMNKAIETQEERIRREAGERAKAVEESMRLRQIKIPGLEAYNLKGDPNARGGRGAGAGAGTPRVEEENFIPDNSLTALNTQLNQDTSAIQTAYDNRRALLEQRHKAELVSEGTYQAQSLALTLKHENDTREAVMGSIAKMATEKAKEEDRIKAAFNKPSEKKERDQRLENLNTTYNKQVEGANATVAKLNSTALRRHEETVIRLDGEILKLTKDNDAYWLKAELGAQKEEALAKTRMAAVGVSEEVRAAMEAETRVAEQHAPQMEKLQQTYDKAVKDLADFNNELERNGVVGTEASLKSSTLAKQIEVLAGQIKAGTASITDLQSRAANTAMLDVQQKAAAAALEKQRQMYEDHAKSLNTDIASAIYDAGKDGGESLRRVLEEQLIRKPFIMVIEAMIKPATDTISSTLMNLVKAAIGTYAPGGAGPGYSSIPTGMMPSGVEMDGGGHTGSGARSGGLDGKGGFMAMLHPQETVVDHYRGQSLGGGTVVEINNYGGPEPTVTESTDSRGRRRVSIAMGEMMAAEMQRPGSSVHRSSRTAFGSKPTLVRR